MPASEVTSGLTEVMSMNREIDDDKSHEQDKTKVVKLRFTRKQYQAFRDACKIFEVVSKDSKFIDFVKSVLGDDVKVPTINKQFVQPILEAPVRIPIKIPRVTAEGGQKRETYFTAPTPATEKCLLLFAAVETEGVDLKQNIEEGVTCVTDVRVMMSRYIGKNDLRTDDGVVLDDFICKLVPKSVHENDDQLHRVYGNLVIPKGNRKVMSAILNEIAFDK